MTKADLAIVQILFAAILTVISITIAVLMLQHAKRIRSLKVRLQAHWLWCGVFSISAYLFLPAVAYLYTEHLWFEHVGYANIFWGLLKGRWGLLIKFAAIALVFIGINSFVGHRVCPIPAEFSRWTRSRTKHFYVFQAFLIFSISIVLAVPMMFFWDDFVRYDNGPEWTGTPETVFQKLLFVANEELATDLDTSGVTESLRREFEKNGVVLSQNVDLRAFGLNRKSVKWVINDGGNKKTYSIVKEDDKLSFYVPKDLSFFLFKFPVYQWVSLWLKVLMWFNLLVTGFLYNFYYRRDPQTMARVEHYLVVHGAILWLMLLAVSLWRSQISIWGILYRSRVPLGIGHKIRRIVDGLGYIDNKLIDAYHIYMVCVVVAGITILINLFWRKRVVWYLLIIVWGLSYLLLVQIYPLFVYLVQVRPNPLTAEKPFLTDHIRSTRSAFALDRIEERDQIRGAATLESINRNTEVKENIQLWDRRVLYEVLMDSQFITRFYQFHPYTDVDRYWVDGKYWQVLIAAREVNPLGLTDAQDWVSQKLRYTHGYSVCIAPVNEFSEGNSSPNFWIEGSNYTNSYKNLHINRPQVYYGELTKDYAIVNTRQEEIDHTAQREQYQGFGGVEIGGWFRRLCFAIRFDFGRVLLSSDLKPESRILFWRKIGTRQPDSARMVVDRVSHIAPFLEYDPDPYIVIGNDGQLWWIIDIYVTSHSYPNAKVYVDDTKLKENPLYSEPIFDRFNYIRNPAVAIVNAYSGKVGFYFTKTVQEPVTIAYQRAFQKLLFRIVDEDTERYLDNGIIRGDLRERFGQYGVGLSEEVTVTSRKKEKSIGWRITDTVDGSIYSAEKSGDEIEFYASFFKSRSEIPAGLQNHLRYPDYLTRIQASIYTAYHVEDPEIFYSGSQRWVIPHEKYYSKYQEMVPYYAILKLPGESKPEFVNMIPFSPPSPTHVLQERKEEPGKLMNAWLVARCDAEHYGQLVVYKLPKGETVVGPAQVEGDIEIAMSEKISLWNQQGTKVIRGNLLVIPVEDTLFYVEPIYQQPETINRPKLVAVIVNTGNRLVTADTFDQALQQIFGVGISIAPKTETTGQIVERPILTLDELTKLANEKYNEYLKLTGESNFVEAAQALSDLGENLKLLKSLE